MKYLKYILLALLLLILIFFGRGLLTPAIAYENEIIVENSADIAWAVMSDETKLPEWIDGFKRTELLSGTANTIGAVSNIYVAEGEGEMMMEETITNMKINELMAMTFRMDFMDMDYQLKMNEEGGKTMIRTKSVTRGNGIFARSMISFMKSAMGEQEDKNLVNLKNLIEGNTTDYFTLSVE